MGRPKLDEEARRFNEALGRRIVGARVASGMNPAALARAAGVGLSSLCQYETGARSCPAIVVRRIAEALGISTGALIPRFAGARKATPNEANSQIENIP